MIVGEDKEEEKAYEVKDKRRVNPNGTLKEEAAEQETAAAEPEQQAETEAKAPSETQEQPETEAQAPGEPQEQPSEAAEMPAPSVFDLLQFVAGMIAEQAWLHMGLRLAPGQKEPTKDLVQAKVAVDTVVFIADKVHPHVSEEDRRALRALVSDLQINFVKHSQ